MVAAKTDGPDLPPLTPGLIHTQIEALHNLFGAVFFQAMNEGDRKWVESPDYLLVAEFAGIDHNLAERVRRMFLAGQVKEGAFDRLAPPIPPSSRARETWKPRRPATATRPVEMVRAIAGPVEMVRFIAAAMPDAKANDVVRACMAAGINYSTAAAQVRKYRKALADSNIQSTCMP